MDVINGHQVRWQIGRGLLNRMIFYIKVVRLQYHNRVLSVLCVSHSVDLDRYVTGKFNQEPFPIQNSFGSRVLQLVPPKGPKCETWAQPSRLGPSVTNVLLLRLLPGGTEVYIHVKWSHDLVM